jgi:RES domain-containing protein
VKIASCGVDQRNTHRLIPAQFAEDGAPAVALLAEGETNLNGVLELDRATDDRFLAESRRSPGVDARELVFGIPVYRTINAAFCHPALNGSRFNSADRGAWYASFELETSQAEAAYHRQLWLKETHWNEEDIADYVDYLADFRAEFHDIRESQEHLGCLSPNNYIASQALAFELLGIGSSGIVYPSVRRTRGSCIVCFRPVLVTNVRKGDTFTFAFTNSQAVPTIRKA